MDSDVLCLFCCCVYVCVDTGTALENGEQEAHGVQKPGKIYSTIPSAAGQSPKAAWSSSSTDHGLFIFSCLLTLFTSFLFFTSAPFCVCVCDTLSIISGLSEQDVNCSHCSSTAFQFPTKYKTLTLSLFFTSQLFIHSSSTEEKKA